MEYVRQAVEWALCTLEQFTISEAEIFRYIADTCRATEMVTSYTAVCVKPRLSVTLPAFAAECRQRSMAHPTIDRHLLQTPALSSKALINETDIQTDVRPLHRPCSTCCVGSISKMPSLRRSNHGCHSTTFCVWNNSSIQQ